MYIISLQDKIMAYRCIPYGDLMFKIMALKELTKNKTLIKLGDANSNNMGSITVWETTENLFLILYLFNNNEDYFTITCENKKNKDIVVNKLIKIFKNNLIPTNEEFEKYEIKLK